MKLRTKKKVKEILSNINLDQEIINYFLDSIKYCQDNNIHKLDINLTRELYPVLAEKYDLTTNSIERKLIHALKHSYNTSGPVVYFKNLGYEKRISVKKLLIILISMIEKEEISTYTRKK